MASAVLGSPPAMLSLLLLTSWLLLVQCQSSSNIALANNAPLSGSLRADISAYFEFSNAVSGNTVLMSVSASIGFPTLYVSPNISQPSVATALYTSSYVTGGAIAVTPATVGVWYLTVQSSAYSVCNFTVVATSYVPGADTSTIPLSDALPQSSVIAAGEYRYYAYDLSVTSSYLNVADTNSLGQTVLLVNGPDNTALPTISSCDYSTFSTSLQLLSVALPVVGTYTIAVWSATTTSFTIQAIKGDSVLPMQLGVVYPGHADQQVLQSYSVYLDPLELPTSSSLTFNLYSLTGDADLYCTNTSAAPVNYTNARWYSLNWAPPDQVVIPGTQLWPGYYYCSVLGFTNASYTFTASFQTSVSLTAQDELFVETVANSQQTYSITLIGNSSSAGALSISVVSQYGSAALWVTPYGVIPTQTPYAFYWAAPNSSPLQALQVILSDACNRGAIPKSDPPQCGLNVLVVTATASLYRLAISSPQNPLTVLPGQLMEGAVIAGRVFALDFFVPNNLCNVTLIIGMQTGLEQATLSIGQSTVGSYSQLGSIWTFQQTLGSTLLVFQLDWTNPLLPYRGAMQGRYTAFLNAVWNSTFTISFQVTNASGYNGSPTPLIAGVTEYGALPAGQYNFYTFTPSAQNWPYPVVFSVSFNNGQGTLLASVGDGQSLGPTVSSYRWQGPVISVSPTSAAVCSPTGVQPSGLPCTYQLSVQAAYIPANSSTSTLTEYSISVVTGAAISQLYYYNTAQSSAMAVGDVQYWNLLVFSGGSFVNILALVTVQSGQVVMRGSNATLLPNATTAQQTTTVLGTNMQVSTGTSLGYASYFVAVECVSSMACAYTMQCISSSSATGSNLAGLSTTNGASIPGAVAAGDLFTYYVTLSRLSSAGYLLITVVPLLGNANIYVSTSASAYSTPSESSYTWSALGPGTLQLELTNFNTSTYLLVSVRGAGGNCAFTISASIAGVRSDITSGGVGYGITTAAYPASYYRCNAPTPTPASVLSFGALSAVCTSSIALYVSDSNPYPGPGTAGVDYNFSSSALALGDGTMATTVTIVSSTLPAGSLHGGMWYMAVVGSFQGTCDFQVWAGYNQQRPLTIGSTTYWWATRTTPIYFTYQMQAGSSVSFAIRLGSSTSGTQASATVYVGINQAVNPADPTTYVIVNAYNSSTHPVPLSAIYVPASACPLTPTSLLSGCTLQILASTPWSYQYVYVSTMSSISVSQLQPEQNVVGHVTASHPVSYQLALPAHSLQLSVAINSAAPVWLYCSHQYITPTEAWNEWSTATSSNSSVLQVNWPAALLNSIAGIAVPSQGCYCSVVTSNDGTSSYVLSYTYTNSGSGRLSSGALAAAIVLPVVFTVAILAMLLWWRSVQRGKGSRDDGAPRRAMWSGSGSSMGRREEDQGPVSELQSMAAVGGRSVLLQNIRSSDQ